jgi:hypothetical protein
MSHTQKSQKSQKSKHCKKDKCFCLRVPYNPHITYNVENVNENPIAYVKYCKCCCKVKQHPFNQTVVVTPIPVSSF